QLRAYRAGDPPRTIAWKHSARRDTLVVREFERAEGRELVLDWRDLSALALEPRIARLAAWIDQAEREGRRYRLRLPAQDDIGPGQGPEHRHACLRALALLPDGAPWLAPPSRCRRPPAPGPWPLPALACCRCCCSCPRAWPLAWPRPRWRRPPAPGAGRCPRGCACC